MANPNKLIVRWHALVNDVIYRFARSILRRRPNKRFLVLLGGPGAGKGTLALQLAPALGIAHLGMGDVLRREDVQKEFGDRLSEMRRGGLVPPALVLEILERELTLPAYT